jgi:predicted dehydrogenase
VQGIKLLLHQFMNSLRIGVLGCGQIAVEQHLPVLAALPDVHIAWLADIDDKSAAQAAQVYGCRTASLRHLAAALGEIDILLVAAPCGARGQYYDVIRDGNDALAVFVEKPFARTVSEHLAISAMRRPGRIACGLSRRATPNVVAVKNML